MPPPSQYLRPAAGPTPDCDDSGFKDKVVEHYNRTALESIKNRLISSAEGLHPSPAESVAKEVIGKISDIKLADVRLVSKNEQTKEAALRSITPLPLMARRTRTDQVSLGVSVDSEGNQCVGLQRGRLESIKHDCNGNKQIL